MNKVMSNILVIDDDESMRTGVSQTLMESGYHVQMAEDGKSGLEKISFSAFDLVILDLKMPGLGGMETLKCIKSEYPQISVIIITGYASIENAVEAMKFGAVDFLQKPFTPEALTLAVTGIVERKKTLLAESCINDAIDEQFVADHILGQSEPMERMKTLIKKAALVDSTVLITGETGSGKELVAQTLHKLSNRRNKPFITIDCGALVETLFESEMFGHVKGAFTGAIETTLGKFELAQGGTIFLDEISNINIDLQARLLRVLQEREICKVGSSQKINIDVRVISATNRELRHEIREGNFREDLFYRLNVLPIPVPPLRERGDDIELLAKIYLKKFSRIENELVKDISPAAISLLKDYRWPGNVRELINIIECAVVNADREIIDIQDLIFEHGRIEIDRTCEDMNSLGSVGALCEVEKNEILKALKRFNGNKTRAANFLGINRKTLREKISKFGI